MFRAPMNRHETVSFFFLVIFIELSTTRRDHRGGTRAITSIVHRSLGVPIARPGTRPRLFHRDPRDIILLPHLLSSLFPCFFYPDSWKRFTPAACPICDERRRWSGERAHTPTWIETVSRQGPSCCARLSSGPWKNLRFPGGDHGLRGQ